MFVLSATEHQRAALTVQGLIHNTRAASLWNKLVHVADSHLLVEEHSA